MFDTDLVLNDGTVDKTFSLVSVVEGKALRRRTDATVGEPETLTISHVKRDPKNPDSADRHLVRLDTVKHDADGAPQTMSWYIVGEIPNDGTFTSTEARTLYLRLINAIGAEARFAKFINNEP
jgi:hypothetical protein